MLPKFEYVPHSIRRDHGALWARHYIDRPILVIALAPSGRIVIHIVNSPKRFQLTPSHLQRDKRRSSGKKARASRRADPR